MSYVILFVMFYIKFRILYCYFLKYALISRHKCTMRDQHVSVQNITLIHGHLNVKQVVNVDDELPEIQC